MIVQEEKRLNFIDKSQKLIQFINKIAIKQKCGPAFRSLLKNVHQIKAQNAIKDNSESYKQDCQKSQNLIK